MTDCTVLQKVWTALQPSTHNLQNKGLKGNIPQDIGQLTELLSINLAVNSLTGSLPDVQLPKLTELFLARNSLSGSIPPSIGGFPQLTRLLLDNNTLSGPLPPSMGNLQNLQILTLSFNQLSGPIPSDLGKLNKLSLVLLQNNSLTGPIPSAWSSLPISTNPANCQIFSSTECCNLGTICVAPNTTVRAPCGTPATCPLVTSTPATSGLVPTAKSTPETTSQPNTPFFTTQNIALIVVGIAVVISCVVIAIMWRRRKSKRESLTPPPFKTPKDDFPIAVEPRDDTFDPGHMFANGAYGPLYKGQFQGKTVAIKRIKTSNMQQTQVQELLSELTKRMDLEHPRIISLLAVVEEENDMSLVSQYIQCKALDVFIAQEDMLEPEQLFTIGLDVASAMTYLHSQRIVHCNLKSSNILIEHDQRAIVTDFGLSSIIPLRNPEQHADAYYMAPECIAAGVYNQTTDVYAFAMILWELFSWRQPYDGREPQEIVPMVMQGYRLPVDGFPPGIQTLVSLSWDGEAGVRPPFTSIKRRLTTMKDDAITNRSLFAYSNSTVSHEEPEAPPPVNRAIKRKPVPAFTTVIVEDPFEPSSPIISGDDTIKAPLPMFAPDLSASLPSQRKTSLSESVRKPSVSESQRKPSLTESVPKQTSPVFRKASLSESVRKPSVSESGRKPSLQESVRKGSIPVNTRRPSIQAPLTFEDLRNKNPEAAEIWNIAAGGNSTKNVYWFRFFSALFYHLEFNISIEYIDTDALRLVLDPNDENKDQLSFSHFCSFVGDTPVQQVFAPFIKPIRRPSTVEDMQPEPQPDDSFWQRILEQSLDSVPEDPETSKMMDSLARIKRERRFKTVNNKDRLEVISMEPQ
ncbi:kinase-like domain-containing protein [Gorgonomyces haynaldii]|nr:kinase-like domain-containing protein [Gorgonomyces haynaldii]